jgi:hypothetical protein
MLIYSMSVSVDGFIADREGGIGWGATRPQALRDDARVGDRSHENVPLDLIETRTFGSRVIFERYGRT